MLGWWQNFASILLSPLCCLPKSFAKPQPLFSPLFLTISLSLSLSPSPFLSLFGQRPRRGRCPVEHRGTFVCSFVRLFVRPPLPPRGSNPSLGAQIPASGLKSSPRGSNPSLRAQIPALGLKSQSRGSNPSLGVLIPASGLKFQPWGLNPSLGAQIPASGLKSSP